MQNNRLGGVIAAIPTPLNVDLRPDLGKLHAFAERLIEDGCHGINLLGTTGEATSFNVETRLVVLKSFHDRADLLARMMVGTGAAAMDDAVTLTKAADQAGFNGVLVLPPFYYKGISQRGLADWISTLIARAELKRSNIYLYNFPQMTGLKFEKEAVSILRDRYGDRIAGLKDSSGDIDYASDIARSFPDFDIFPSDEGTLVERQERKFAGCISASVNVAAHLARAAFDDPHAAQASGAVARMRKVRAMLSALPLVPAVKAAVGNRLGDASWRAMMPPLSRLTEAEVDTLHAELADIMSSLEAAVLG